MLVTYESYVKRGVVISRNPFCGNKDTNQLVSCNDGM